MIKKTHLAFFIFVLVAGTAHINLTASEEQEREDRAGICQRVRQIFNTIFSTNQRADLAEKSKSAKKKELTDTEVEKILTETMSGLPNDLAKIIVNHTKEIKLKKESKGVSFAELNDLVRKFSDALTPCPTNRSMIEHLEACYLRPPAPGDPGYSF